MNRQSKQKVGEDEANSAMKGRQRAMKRDSFRVVWTIKKGDLACDYLVTPIREPHPEVARFAWRFRKYDSEGKPTPEAYDVRVTPSGLVLCDCPGGTTYGRCKHARCVRVFLGMGPDRPTTPAQAAVESCRGGGEEGEEGELAA